jgi:hypothetical protein
MPQFRNKVSASIPKRHTGRPVFTGLCLLDDTRFYAKMRTSCEAAFMPTQPGYAVFQQTDEGPSIDLCSAAQISASIGKQYY